MKDLIINILTEYKAIDIINFDVRTSSIADDIIIASGTSARHIAALAQYVLRALKEQNCKNILVEGLEGCEWVLIDLGDAIIHILSQEMRQFYDLEGLFTQLSDKRKRHCS